MHYDKVALVIIMTLLLVAFYNVGLFFAYRDDEKKTSLGHMMDRVSKQAKDPWKQEDDALKELSQRVHDLQSVKEDKDPEQVIRDAPEPLQVSTESAKSEKDPWKQKDDLLKELSQRVHDLHSVKENNDQGHVSRDAPEPFQVSTESAKSAKDPWKQNDDDLKELSQLIHELQAIKENRNQGQKGEDRPARVHSATKDADRTNEGPKVT